MRKWENIICAKYLEEIVLNKNMHYSSLSIYYSDLNSYLKYKYGEKVLKICLDGGFTCPNRDGRNGNGGCIFCNERGAGEYLDRTLTIAEQFNNVSAKVANKRHCKAFIAYFQNYTGTYDSIQNLKKKYYEAVSNEKVKILAIATRPDCINFQILELLSNIQAEKNIDIWIELGLQSIHDETAKIINRCYETNVFYEAVEMLRKRNFDVIVHLMFGLPGETKEKMLETIYAVRKLDIQGIKFHNVNVMKNTELERLFWEGKYTPLNLSEYVDILAESIMLLPKRIIVHRLVSDCKGDLLVAPEWASNKLLMLNEITRKFACDEIEQGKKIQI